MGEIHAAILNDILQASVQEFILQHETDDESKLLLKHKSIGGVPAALIADQIAGRRKAKQKLPTWYATPNILYPPSINIEQSSSETTATYKTKLLQETLKAPFNRAADLTGGFGVDSFFLASLFTQIDYIEPDENLFELVQHNHRTLPPSRMKNRALHILHHHITAEQFLQVSRDKFSLLYIDPSRRTKGNQKIFRFADCQPDVVQLLPRIFELTEYLLVKASPLIDLRVGINELRGVEKIFVIAANNECKEVLFLCHKDFRGEPTIRAINLKSDADASYHSFDFLFSEEKDAVVTFSKPLAYLFEPNVAILKSGAFKLIGNRYQLHKLQQNTHLYTSEYFVPDFPGRVFKIEALIKSDPKIVRHYFPEGKGNVLTRNYPLSSEELKKKSGLKDGGEKFLIGFSGVAEKFTAVCTKVN